MADRTIVGSLIIQTSVEGGPFSAAMSRMSATAASASGRLRRSFDTTTGSVERLNAAARRTNGLRLNNFMAASRIFQDTANRANNLRSTLLGLTSVFGGFSAALAISAVTSYADSFRELQNRLRIVTSSQQELLMVQEALNRIANDSRVGIRETTILYSRMAVAASKLGLSQKQLLDVTETIQKAFIVGGSTPIEAAQSAIQLSQGIASNRLGGDELRSILENQALGQLLANQIAEGDIGKLRQLSKEGKLTAKVLVQAFLGARDSIKTMFAQTVPTISQAFTILDNALIDYIGKADQAAGASQVLINAIKFLAANFKQFADVLIVVGGLLATRFAAGGAAALLGTITGMGRSLAAIVPAERAARLAMAGQALAATQTAAAVNLAAQAELNAARAAAVKTAADLRGAQAGLANAKASAALGATVATTSRSMTAALAANAAAQARLAAAQRASVLATRVATAATAAHAVALRATGIAATAAAAAMRGFATVIAFLGGPLNAAILAGAAAWYFLSQRETEASRIAEAHAATMEDLRSRILNVTSATREQQQALRDALAAEKIVAEQRLKELQHQRSLEMAAASSRAASGAQSVFGGGPDPETFLKLQQQAADEITRNWEPALQEAGAAVKDVTEAQGLLNQTLDAGQAPLASLTELMDGGSESAEKLAKAIAELTDGLMLMPLDDFNAKVAQAALNAGIAREDVEAFVNAVQSGRDLMSDVSVPTEILDIQQLMRITEAWDAFQKEISQTNPVIATARANLNGALADAEDLLDTATQRAIALMDSLIQLGANDLVTEEQIDQLKGLRDQFDLGIIDAEALRSTLITMGNASPNFGAAIAALLNLMNTISAVIGAIGSLRAALGGLATVGAPSPDHALARAAEDRSMQTLKENTDRYATEINRRAALSDRERDIEDKIKTIRHNAAQAGAAMGNARARQLAITDLGPVSGGSGGKGKGGKGGKGGSENEFEREIAQIQKRIEETNLETEAIGKSRLEAEKAKTAMDLLRAAKEADIPVTEEVKGKIEQLSSAYAEAVVRLEQAQAAHERFKETINEFKSLASDMLKGFIKDLRDGKTATEALNNALDKIVDKLIDMAIDKVVELAFGALLDGGIGGTGGGILKGLFGGLFGGKGIGGSSMRASVAHAGGIIGRSSFPRRDLPRALFMDAPRLHAGGILGPGEHAFIGRTGERVLPPGASAGGGDINLSVKVIDNVGTRVSAKTEEREDGQRELVVMVDEIVASHINKRTSKTTQALQSNFRLSRPMTRR